MKAATTRPQAGMSGEAGAEDGVGVAYVVALCLTEGAEDAAALLLRAAGRVRLARQAGERRGAGSGRDGVGAVLLRALVAECGGDVIRLCDDGPAAGPRRSAAGCAARRSAGFPEPRLRTPAELESSGVVEGIRRLPAGFRTVQALYFAMDRSYDAVAHILEVPVTVVRVHVRRSRPMLHDALGLLDVSDRVV